MAIRTLSTREIYRNPWLSLREDAIQRSNGAEGIYSVVDKREETGLTAGRMTELPWMWIAYGFTRQRQHVFVAEELVPRGHQRDPEESDMEIVRMPIAAFEQKLREGEIRDVCTLGAWASYRLWRESPG